MARAYFTGSSLNVYFRLFAAGREAALRWPSHSWSASPSVVQWSQRYHCDSRSACGTARWAVNRALCTRAASMNRCWRPLGEKPDLTLRALLAGAGRVRDQGQLLRGLVILLRPRKASRFKKKPARRRAGSARRRQAAANAGRRLQSRLDPARLVFIDETWAKTNMTRAARALRPRGRRLRRQCPARLWRTLTFMAALRCDRIDRALRLRRADQRRLVPRLCRADPGSTLRPGDIVVIDNLGSHKGKAVRRSYPSRRRQAVLPAALQPRPQSDRAGLRQAQDPAAQG